MASRIVGVVSTPGLLGALVAVTAIVAATVAVCLHAIAGGEYVALVAGFGGFGAGAGAHAAGVTQAKA
jgi:hypothetical protein